MSKIYKGSLLATTVIAGMSFTTAAFAQVVTTPPTNVQGTGVPAPADAATPEAGVQSTEAAGPAEPTSSARHRRHRHPDPQPEPGRVRAGHGRRPGRNPASPVERRRRSSARPSGRRPVASARHVNNGNGGASYVDLRGLGSNRNLVLLDGTRIVPADLVGRVDLNNIPLALVDRVDVLTGGAATDLRRRRRVGRRQLHHPQRLRGCRADRQLEQITERATATSSAPT